jgi:hypothetical protein
LQISFAFIFCKQKQKVKDFNDGRRQTQQHQ